MGKKKSYLIDPSVLLAAGIDPKTGKPMRVAPCEVKESFRKALRIIDEQNAVNRYKWHNIPMDLTSEEIERMLYYKGQLMFFMMNIDGVDKFFLTPYALNGTIDFYGRFNFVKPVPWASGQDDSKADTKEKFNKDALASLLSLQVRKVMKAPVMEEDLTLEIFENGCVLLHDYTKQISQTIIPRRDINEGIIDFESDIIPLLRLSLLNASGIKAIKVPDADAQDEAETASANMYASALKGWPFVPVTAKMDLQDLGDGKAAKPESLLLTLQSLDNIRLSTYGIDNGGIFQKKAHVLEREAMMNASDTEATFQDGLSIRQHFCNIVNSIWGCMMWCTPSEATIKQDLNANGKAFDEDLGEQGGVSSVDSSSEPEEGAQNE